MPDWQKEVKENIPQEKLHSGMDISTLTMKEKPANMSIIKCLFSRVSCFHRSLQTLVNSFFLLVHDICFFAFPFSYH